MERVRSASDSVPGTANVQVPKASYGAYPVATGRIGAVGLREDQHAGAVGAARERYLRPEGARRLVCRAMRFALAQRRQASSREGSRGERR